MPIYAPSSTVAGPLGAIQYADNLGGGPLNQSGSRKLLWDDAAGTLALGSPAGATIAGADAVVGDLDQAEGATLTVEGGASLATYATLTISFSGQPSDGQQLGLGGKFYAWQAVLTDEDNNVQIGATLADTIANLVAAINQDPAARGVAYANSMSPNGYVRVSSYNATDITLVSLETGNNANSRAVNTLTSPVLPAGVTHLSGGLNPSAGGFIELAKGANGGDAGSATLSGGDNRTNLASEGRGGSAHVVGTDATSSSGTGDFDGGDVHIKLGAKIGAGRDGLIIIEGAPLPTVDPVFAGALWNDGGALKISAG